MGILGINNRTENWKTVQHFHGLSDAAKVRLVQHLEPEETVAAGKICIELFWRGMRDYDKKHNVSTDDLVRSYRSCFSDLRKDICAFPGLRPLKDDNYAVPASPRDRERLANNLKNTEVDIVLATPSRIFVGEAKDESDLGTNSDLVLVHQLIRQYVTVKVLVDLLGCPIEHVVPFVVGEKKLSDKRQVKFMVKQGWLRECNVLTWSELRILCGH